MSKTVVGLFNSMAEANKVKQQLVSQGYDSQDVNVVANDDDDVDGSYINSSGINSAGTSSTGIDSRRTSDTDAYDTTRSTGDRTDLNYDGRDSESRGTGIGEKISHFFRSLTGGDEDVHHHYASGVNSGGALLAVKVEDAQANEMAAMLKQHGAREIEGGAQDTGSRGYGAMAAGAAGVAGTAATGYAAGSELGEAARTGAAMVGEQVIPIIEEELTVGKREVDRGGVRVYSHVTERPAEANVTLREERINVERRPVNRAATAADFEAGRGSTIELNAMSEEAVVGKSSRVVEEVLVGKQSTERTEHIHDTVRKTEVEVENVSGMEGRSKGVRSSDDLEDESGTGTKDRY